MTPGQTVCSTCLDAARFTCAADGGPADWVPEARRRAGDRRAQDPSGLRMPLSEPQMVGRLVEVPAPEAVLVARGPDLAGTERRQHVEMGGTHW